MSSIWMLGRVWSPPNTVMLAVAQRLHGQHVDRHVEAHARRVAAHSRRPHDLHDHVVSVGQHDALGAHLGLVVLRDRHQLEILGHLLLVLDAIDAARGGIDEALDAAPHRTVGELHGGEAADLPSQLGIEIAARIVGDAGEVDDGIDAVEVISSMIAHVAAARPADPGAGRARCRTTSHVERDDLMARAQQLRHEHAALVAAGARDQNFHVRPAIRSEVNSMRPRVI